MIIKCLLMRLNVLVLVCVFAWVRSNELALDTITCMSFNDSVIKCVSNTLHRSLTDELHLKQIHYRTLVKTPKFIRIPIVNISSSAIHLYNFPFGYKGCVCTATKKVKEQNWKHTYNSDSYTYTYTLDSIFRVGKQRKRHRER